MADIKQLPVRIPKKLWEEFSIILIKKQTSAQKVLLKAIEEYVEENKSIINTSITSEENINKDK